MIALGAEVEAAAWFRLDDPRSRVFAEEHIRIAFNRLRWHESVVLSGPHLAVMKPGDARCPQPPAGVSPFLARLLYGEAVVVAYAPQRADVLGAPFLKTLSLDDVAALRAATKRAYAQANPEKPPLTDDAADAAIEMLGPDVARKTLLNGAR